MGKTSMLLRDRRFWYVAALLGIAIILVYVIEPNLLERAPGLRKWHAVFITIRNFILLGTVTLGALRFGFMGGLAITLVIVIGLLPHVLAEAVIGEFNSETLLEYGIFIPIGVVIAWLIETRTRLENNLKDSEKRYRRLFETDRDGILILNGDTRQIIDANPAVKDLLGYSPEELRDKHLWEVGEFKNILADKISLQQLYEGGYKRWDDLPFVARDGQRILLEIITNAYQVDHSRVIQCNIRDMTLTNQAMEALSEVIQDLKIAQRLTKIGNWKWVIATNKVTWSDELCRINGWDPEVPVPPFAEMERFYAPESWEYLNKLVTDTFNTGISYEVELTQIRTDGTMITTLSRGEADYDAGGKIVSLHGTVQDITERKRAEKSLSESERRYRSLVESASDCIFLVDKNFTILSVNAAGASLLQRKPSEIVGKRLSELFSESVATEYKKSIRRIFETGVSSAFEGSFSEGINEMYISTILNPVKDDNNNVVGVLGVVRDTTEHKRDEETLRLQAELLDAELDSVYLHDFEGNFTYVNRAAYLTHGYTKEELLNMKLSQLDDPESAKLIAPRLKEISEGKGATFEVNHRHKNGSLIPMEVHASPIQLGGKNLIMSVAHDITERQKMLEQLMLQDRLASIGQLASGTAHEINNPLTGVIGFSELLLKREYLPDDVKEDLKVVNGEAMRASRIVKNLLTFARGQRSEKLRTDINSIIQSVLEMRSYEHKVSNIEVNTQLAAGLPDVSGNETQLQQVFVNIIVNAEQAMLEAHNRGTLTITTESVGGIIKASVADDGPGVSKENMSKLFTPFFTTKDVGKGTGLGLSICHGIITEHGGRIYARSEPGQGATFIIELPVHK